MASQDEISKHRGATTEGETSNHPAATTEGDMSMKGSLQLTSHHNQTENAVEDSEQKIISKDNTGSCETMHPTTIHSTTIALPVKRNLLEDHTYTLAGEDGFVRDGLSCKTEDQSYAEEQLSPKRRKLSPPVADPTDLQYRRSTSPNEEKLRSRLRSPSITPSCASSLTTLDQLEARGMSPPRGCDASNVTTHSNRSTPGRAQSQSQNKPKTTKFAEKESKLVEKAAEKARKDQDREARRKQKQLDDAIKDEKRRQREAERAAKDEQKRLRDEEKKKKEDEKAKFEEEKRRRDGVQRTLGSFFATPKQRVAAVANAPVTVVTSGLESHTTEVPSEGTTNHPYRKLFPPFYLNEHVQLAPTCRFAHGNLDEAWDVHALDAILAGDSHASTSDALAIFRQGNTHRGTSFPSVRSIIANMDGISNNGGGNSESQSSQMIRGREQLQQVPVKYIKFAEDVRPPYRGTFTMSPLHGIHKLARSPWRRDHPSTDYNYDSEAEWVEDEDAEDCESNGDEEEEIEDAEEMDDFLDDENDDLLHARRPVFHGELVPTSTGLCWEDQRPPCANADLMVYKMEVIIDHSLKNIDPLATSYWREDVKVLATIIEPPRPPLHTMKSANANASMMQLPSAMAASIKKEQSNSNTGNLGKISAVSSKSNACVKADVLLDAADLPRFKEAISGSNLSKIGLVEVLKKSFPGRRAAAIKNTLERVARREGLKATDKRWVLVEEGLSPP